MASESARLLMTVLLFTVPSCTTKKETDLLQSDLKAVGSWENTWLMQFNADKCFTMRTGIGEKNN